jgi:hypothetical protein
MIILNTAVTITWNLPPTESVYAAGVWDLLTNTPDGLSSYADNLTEDSYVAPTEITAGSITVTFTFTQGGLHKLTLSTGTADAYTRISENLINVIVPTTTQSISARY